MSFFTRLFGDPNRKYLAKFTPILEAINALEAKYSAMKNEEFKTLTVLFRERLAKGESLDEILPDAFAATREVAKRVLGKRHYDVQLLGAMVLHRGAISEMRTGEGKTQTAALSAYLNALSGKGVHVITVNDYLAKRDALWMGQIYGFLGMNVGCLQHSSAFRRKDMAHDSVDDVRGVNVNVDWLEPISRRDAYSCDILYGTNSEFGFDYLRDNMVESAARMVQRPLAYAIIDEVDSILIDEARTPLIISAPSSQSSEKYFQFAQLVTLLSENADYNVDEKMRTSTLTEKGITKLEKALGVENIYVSAGIATVHHIEQALRAHALFKKDRDYVAKDGEIIIVDEFTGRLMQGRRYGEGLHQAIEAKEGLRVREESQTLATITIQNFFRLYTKLSGMTGTAATEAEEFSKIYSLEVVTIPTHATMVRQDLPDRIYRTENGKFEAIVREVKERHAKGQPVLLGTVSIQKNEILAEMFRKAGIPHQILNAKAHEREAEIIAQAGKPGSVTVATNMAGRGVDIILGGNPGNPLDAQKVKESGGLFVIGTERHESRRIDNQLRGRSGRQGDPGVTQFYLSMEDDLMRIFGAMERMKSLMKQLGLPEDVPIENKLVSRSIESAQHKVEGHNFDVRKHVLEYDDVINKHRDAIYKRRRAILEDFEKDPMGIRAKVWDMIEGEIEQVVSFHTSAEDVAAWNIKEVGEVARTIFPSKEEEWKILAPEVVSENSKLGAVHAREQIVQSILDLARASYERLEGTVQAAFPANANMFRQIEKDILLRSIDSLWIEHLTSMDHLRTGIRLRGYAQKDPLVEYKKEAFRMYSELLNLIQKQVVYTLYKIGVVQQLAPTVSPTAPVSYSDPEKTLQKSDFGGDHDDDEVPMKTEPQTAVPKVGRNEDCPCGSGKKYKKCHGV
ncbi:MAG: preprotein translocase subunit SecA [Parcubacteria group bacterium Gr01-1014_18]|nr:MAG: preprotein translocase subunit SecA [Parcubacteria group bacterium Greene0416_36]TSC80121.1 MAG: preprotein translocase subunit SecA [Parcubacteria group bacterium Gr01-1014_18]TSC99335.1 MAG: preprotein translocase subunit SecA [Parcubacteria group bacterium Greene1014_20]TSD06828.1 MAG: preprotein translocase subunit SecA [Parcubacteria group bacterium Greene0714_2]